MPSLKPTFQLQAQINWSNATRTKLTPVTQLWPAAPIRGPILRHDGGALVQRGVNKVPSPIVQL